MTSGADRILGTPTLEERADDIRAVMAAAGSTQAAILGWGDGGAMAAMFAATYPGCATALVLGSLAVKLNEVAATVGDAQRRRRAAALGD